MDHLDHENLDAYQRSLDFEREIRDQLKRAALSISLNIAEGAGKPAQADRVRARTRWGQGAPAGRTGPVTARHETTSRGRE